jgi:hypothetical protein
MTITAQKVVTDARIILNDVAGTRWGDAEMLSWVNAGRRDMAMLKPTVWNQTAKRQVTLAAGAYQAFHTLGLTEASALVDVLNNVNADNSVGTVIKNTTRQQLDSFRPQWKTETGNTVQNWFKDEASHYAFWVYPAVAGGKIDVNISVAPTDLASLTLQCVPLDVMATTLMHYVLYRAYAKDSEVAQNAALSQSYLQLFTAALAAA